MEFLSEGGGGGNTTTFHSSAVGRGTCSKQFVCWPGPLALIRFDFVSFWPKLARSLCVKVADGAADEQKEGEEEWKGEEEHKKERAKEENAKYKSIKTRTLEKQRDDEATREGASVGIMSPFSGSKSFTNSLPLSIILLSHHIFAVAVDSAGHKTLAARQFFTISKGLPWRARRPISGAKTGHGRCTGR